MVEDTQFKIAKDLPMTMARSVSFFQTSYTRCIWGGLIASLLLAGCVDGSDDQGEPLPDSTDVMPIVDGGKVDGLTTCPTAVTDASVAPTARFVKLGLGSYPAIKVSADAAYLSANTSVVTIRHTENTTSRYFGADQPTPSSIAFNDRFVFFLNGRGAPFYKDKTITSGAAAVLVPGVFTGTARGLYADANAVYWIADHQTPNNAACYMHKWSFNAAEPSVVIGSSPGFCGFGLHADASDFYFMSDLRVQKMVRANGSVVALTRGLQPGSQIALDDTKIYISAKTNIYSQAKTGGVVQQLTNEPLTSPYLDVRELKINSSRIYWSRSNPQTAEILYISKDGSERGVAVKSIPLSGPANTTTFDVDEAKLYWIKLLNPTNFYDFKRAPLPLRCTAL